MKHTCFGISPGQLWVMSKENLAYSRLLYGNVMCQAAFISRIPVQTILPIWNYFPHLYIHMPKFSIEGTWKGSATYGESYPPAYRKKVLPFTIDISFNNGMITGTLEDDITQQLSLGPATIEGYYKNYTLHFIKKYPCLIMSDEEGNLKADHSKPSQSIQYNGSIRQQFFLFGKIYFTGFWDITALYNDSDDNIRHYTIGGKWKMERSR